MLLHGHFALCRGGDSVIGSTFNGVPIPGSMRRPPPPQIHFPISNNVNQTLTGAVTRFVVDGKEVPSAALSLTNGICLRLCSI
ncbi:hypothetical protein Hypma_013966 [Hypsizygus marmoreus]|uniref:Uncharacterized protein n=1 Tax=Hypsizygus marmoreus TaxID=39966 RepID=A0A369K990_HYPMA|nr:hypothetical protein Hypma_013966 [Hypsizygus marmoreus]